MKCCNFLGGEIRETRAAGNGSLATLSLNWLQISIVMQILLLRKILPRLGFVAKFPRENPPACEYPLSWYTSSLEDQHVADISERWLSGWCLFREHSSLRKICNSDSRESRLGKQQIKCKFLFHVSSPAIVPDKFRRLLPHDVDKSQLASSLSLNSLSQNQVIRPNPPSHSRNEHLAGVLFVSQHPLLSSPKRPTSREERGWGGGWSWSKEIFTRYGLIVTSNIITPRGNISFIWKLVNGLCAIVGGHYQNGYKVLHPMLLLEAVAGVWKLVLQFVS